METVAVVLRNPGALALERVGCLPAGAEDVLVETAYSGISTGTEKLLWSGRMPPFPGMGYPLVPGYETVGRVVDPGSSGLDEGTFVFVPGARCYGPVKGLFGGAAQRLLVDAGRVTPIDETLGANGTLLALAATARHALAGGPLPKLIVGHGVFGRLLARLTVALGGHPTVIERNPSRQIGARGYRVLDPDEDPRRDYTVIYDASGDSEVIDSLVARAAPGAEIVLAGFYEGRPSFAFPPAFMREIRLRIAAEWRPDDLAAVLALLAEGRLSLDGLISHRAPAADAPEAYRKAFSDPGCLKMILDWRATA
jgi:3-hydroxyethyl bacteriochlorophyllide a dehydrogenase